MRNEDKNKINLFKWYYETNAPSLVLFARRFVSSYIVEDIVHEVFVEIWRKMDSFDKLPGRSYLFTAVRNQCINNLKKEETEATYMHNAQLENRLLGLEYYDSFEKILIEQESMQEIYDQIERLPNKCRQIFKLSYLEEKKNTEIAELLGLSIRTVEHQLYLALRRLRDKLKPE
jgi:RNA polymerase sigma-70 factor (ECF subfamily)